MESKFNSRKAVKKVFGDPWEKRAKKEKLADQDRRARKYRGVGDWIDRFYVENGNVTR